MDKPQVTEPSLGKNNINIWMIISIILIIIFIGIGAYLLGENGSFSRENSVSQQQSVTVVPTVQSSIQIIPINQPVSTASPVPTSISLPITSGTKVNAGGFGSFPKYTIMIPQGWQQNETINNFQDLLTIIKGGQYQLQINQASMENDSCSYPGITPEPMSEQYTTFVPLAYNGDPNYYRRSKSQIPYPNGEDQYAICQKIDFNPYSTVTTFGSILYMAPTTPDQQTLTEMDQMVQSMQKL